MSMLDGLSNFDASIEDIEAAPAWSDQLSYLGDVNQLYHDDPESFHDMVDNAESIDADAFDKLCYGLDDFSRARGYDDSGNLTIKTDYAVQFYKSEYLGKPCAYLTWSGYEYIWI